MCCPAGCLVEDNRPSLSVQQYCFGGQPIRLERPDEGAHHVVDDGFGDGKPEDVGASVETLGYRCISVEIPARMSWLP